MKHGILLLAHRDYDQLRSLLEYFDEDFEVYIHLDRKSAFSDDQMCELEKVPVVKMVSNKYGINWGGHSLLKAIVHMAAEACKSVDLEYVHLISGQDYPIKPLKEFKAFFEQHKGKEFLEYFLLPTERWTEGGLGRLQYYAPYDLFNARGANKALLLRLIKIQKILKIKRSFPRDFPKLYGGSAWWSLTRPCLQHIVQYGLSHPRYFNRFKYTFASDEVYFQTTLMHSPFAENAVNNNLRFIIWPGDIYIGYSPETLTTEVFEKIKTSEHFFARKLVMPDSQPLLDQITKLINQGPAE